MNTKWQYVWMALLGAFLSHIGVTYRMWEFYVVLVLVLAYGIARTSAYSPQRRGPSL